MTSNCGKELAEPGSRQYLGLVDCPQKLLGEGILYSQRHQARQVHQDCLEILEGPRRKSEDTMLTPKTVLSKLDEHLQCHQKEKNEHLRGRQRGLGVLEVPWGPAWEQKKERLTEPAVSGLYLLLAHSQTKDKKILWGRAPNGLQWLLPLLSHSPPLNHLFFIYSTIWTQKLALLSPGWQPCLLKSEFHLACAKPTLQGEISCGKPYGCRRTVAAVCIPQFSFQEQ